MDNSLTSAVVNYQQTGKNWDAVSERINTYAYDFPRRWTSWDADRCSDFYIAFLPRIPGIIQRFKPWYSFETYLASSLRWFIKTFTENLADKEHYTLWCEAESSQEMVLLSEYRPCQVGDFIQIELEQSLECVFDLDSEGRLANETLRRRVLFAVFLSAAEMDTHHIPAFAKVTGVSTEWLEESLEQIRHSLSHKVEKREMLRWRRNECWYRMEAARKRMGSIGEEDRNSFICWKKKYETWLHRYNLASSQIRRFKVVPAQTEIAKIMDIPVGTVASGLHFLRKDWMFTLDLQQKNRIESAHDHSSRHWKSAQKRRIGTHTVSSPRSNAIRYRC